MKLNMRKFQSILKVKTDQKSILF